ncbi:Spy/CpxP family protein refolding chaperone [bacterium]|nr:Spy/CpxP family protein refolding chaperone [bacterium]
MTRSRSIIVWLLAFSLGLNVMFVAMGLSGVSISNAFKKPVPESEKWSYTNLFPLDDPELKLTDEQKKKIAEIRKEIDTQELRLNTQTADRVDRWYNFLLGSRDLTEQAIDPYVVEMRYGTKDLMLRLVNSLNRHRALLTPEQDKILEKRLSDKFKELKGYSQKRLSGTKLRLSAQYGDAFVRSVVGQTSGTLEKKN